MKKVLVVASLLCAGIAHGKPTKAEIKDAMGLLEVLSNNDVGAAQRTNFMLSNCAESPMCSKGDADVLTAIVHADPSAREEMLARASHLDFLAEHKKDDKLTADVWIARGMATPAAYSDASDRQKRARAIIRTVPPILGSIARNV